MAPAIDLYSYYLNDFIDYLPNSAVLRLLSAPLRFINITLWSGNEKRSRHEQK